MTQPRTAFLVAALVLSLIGNAVLGVLYDFKTRDAQLNAEDALYRAEERNFLMKLMPSLRPAAPMDELELIIGAQYPAEQVNVVEGSGCDGCREVQWRLFHFWFDSRGTLVDVQWAS